MANRTVSAESLKEGSVVLIQGKLSFSRLAQLVAGQALVDSIARQRAQGRLYPTTSPYTSVTLTDVQVLFANPSAPTAEEIFVHESTYVSKSGEQVGHTGYSIDNTGNSLPTVLERGDNGSYSQVILERDLATGLDVTLVLNVFKSASYEKRGIGVSQVLVNEKVRYYGGGVDMAALAARGIIIEGGIQIISGTDTVQTSEAVPAGLPVGTVMQAGLPMPGPMAYAPIPVAQMGVESSEQKIARLEAETAALRAAQAGSGGGSPFDLAPEQAGSPWAAPSGIHYQG